MTYQEAVWRFDPACEQELADQRQILAWIRRDGDAVLRRENRAAHLTASALVLNPSRTKVLLVYHHQFQSWSWVGGHADGDRDLLETAVREAREETGLAECAPLLPGIRSLDILPVWGHFKRGEYVPAHLHLNAAYLLTAAENQPLRIKPDENSGVRWVSVRQLEQYVTEERMLPIYEKILKRDGIL